MDSRHACKKGLTLMLGLVVASPLCLAANDSATVTRCTAYAKRAVEQYQLMKAHPGCQVNNDPLTWQDNYTNHFNGCMFLPASMASMAESGRDRHLLACGGEGLTPAPSAASPAPQAQTQAQSPSPEAAQTPQPSRSAPMPSAPPGDASAPAANATISVGQSIDEVTAALGAPDRIITAGAKKIYIYPDLRVLLLNDRVQSVQ